MVIGINGEVYCIMHSDTIIRKSYWNVAKVKVQFTDFYVCLYACECPSLCVWCVSDAIES